jgi:hypothetical protein
MSDQILCPNCGKQIAITQALAKQLQGEVEEKFKKQLETQKQQFQEEKSQLTKLLKDKEETVRRQFEQKEIELKKELWEKAQLKASEKVTLQLKDLKEQVKENEENKKKLEEEVLTTYKKLRNLEEEASKAKIEMEKQLEEERKKIQEKAIEEAFKKADEDHRLKDLEKDKKLEDMRKQIEELKRKAELGSQQNQGEVLELDLEQNLKKCFIHDIVEPIAKGVNGADISQTVCNRSGSTCGVILYEIKQTKNWTEGWISKFKDDYRKAKADIPVLITTSLPKDVNGFALYQGIWVTCPSYAVSLATALRKGLIATAYERSIAKGRGRKSELLFDYISSNEFRQHVETLVEVFTEMQTQLTKEKLAFEKQWKSREKQIERLMLSTASMYGDMQGLVGSAMPEVKGLQFGEVNQLEAGKSSEPTLF